MKKKSSRARRLVGPLLVAASLAAIAGCSSSSGDSSEPAAAVDAESDTLGIANLALPIESYFVSAEEEQTLTQAENLLQTRCMKRFGFDYVVPPRLAPVRPAFIERRYGISDAKLAATRGYKLAPETDAAAAASSTAPMSPAMTKVLHGSGSTTGEAGGAGASSPQELVNGQRIPAGGCVGEARETLGAQPGGQGFNAPEIVNAINVESWDRARADARVRGAITQWSACMKEKGLDYADPSAASGDMGWSREERAVETREITVALADIECKKTTGLAKTWYAVDKELQTARIEKSAEELATVKKNNAESVRKATELTRK